MKSFLGINYWKDENGEYHREDGPALIFSATDYRWFFHGQKHRVGGPAVCYGKNEYAYYQYGKLHRLDGPAIDFPNAKQWWIDGIQIKCNDNEEFLRIVKMKELL
jgi:hypothetical protein